MQQECLIVLIRTNKSPLARASAVARLDVCLFPPFHVHGRLLEAHPTAEMEWKVAAIVFFLCVFVLFVVVGAKTATSSRVFLASVILTK